MPHPSHDTPGTLRRAPAPSFAHAICLDRPHPDMPRWEVIDFYGTLHDNYPENDDHVSDWPIVYVPATPKAWADKTSRLPAPRNTDQQETTR